MYSRCCSSFGRSTQPVALVAIAVVAKPKEMNKITVIPLDLILVFGLASCGPQISDVIEGISNEAVTVSQEVGLVAAGSGPSSDAFTMVGSTGQLTAGQLTTVLHLGWPQSYQAIESALGRPYTRDTYADYYTMPNGHGLTIHYSGGNATGYSLGDSGG